jgi:hypothetical protein
MSNILSSISSISTCETEKKILVELHQGHWMGVVRGENTATPIFG